MSKNYALKADVKNGAGKGIARALRRENKTPAVIYGDGKEPLTISLDENTINVIYNRGYMFTTLCDLSVDKDKHLVLARDVQLHPVTDNVMHVDFLRVTAKTKIAVNVPVNFINEGASPGLQEKGVLNVIRFNVELLCTATSIPDYIEADLSGKNLGDTIKISDAILPEGTSPIIDDRDFTLAILNEPKVIVEVEEESESAEGEEGAEGEAAEGGDAPVEGSEDKPAEEKSE